MYMAKMERERKGISNEKRQTRRKNKRLCEGSSEATVDEHIIQRREKNRIHLKLRRLQESKETKTRRLDEQRLIQKSARMKESPEARERQKYWNKKIWRQD